MSVYYTPFPPARYHRSTELFLNLSYRGLGEVIFYFPEAQSSLEAGLIKNGLRSPIKYQTDENNAVLGFMKELSGLSLKPMRALPTFLRR